MPGQPKVKWLRKKGGSKAIAQRANKGNFTLTSEGTTAKCGIVEIIFNQAAIEQCVGRAILHKGAIVRINTSPIQMKRHPNTGDMPSNLARITTHPGQTGRADGVILEGEELEFYIKQIDGESAKIV